ncbi:MAG: tRNA-dihydrouridine synthase [Anaplasmataceae bacterium]|nr:tRNA-dihydrouridine synthase [Anaplasmataceae bacterium]
MIHFGFWKNLPQPFFALAPMANVTDAAFRALVAKHAPPDVFWTEFVSAHGLASPGKENLLHDLDYSEAERPIVAQFFGSRPEHLREAASLARELKFDGVDINMGCPDKSIERQGAGAALLKNPLRMKELILAAKEGAGDLPVSIKTRTGYHQDSIDDWLPIVLEAEPAAISIHARTRQEMSKVPARWEAVARVREVLDKYFISSDKPLLIGNGDSFSRADGERKAKTYGADGIMIGRGIFHNFWVFEKNYREHTPQERLAILLEHLDLFEDKLKGRKPFPILKKFFKIYVSDFDSAKELRVELMEKKTSKEVSLAISDYFEKTKDSVEPSLSS